jgi:hypothetical protein
MLGIRRKCRQKYTADVREETDEEERKRMKKRRNGWRREETDGKEKKIFSRYQAVKIGADKRKK